MRKKPGRLRSKRNRLLVRRWSKRKWSFLKIGTGLSLIFFMLSEITLAMENMISKVKCTSLRTSKEFLIMPSLRLANNLHPLTLEFLPAPRPNLSMTPHSPNYNSFIQWADMSHSNPCIQTK
jgi:hypothetical protein